MIQMKTFRRLQNCIGLKSLMLNSNQPSAELRLKMTEIQNDDHDLISVDIDKLSKMLTIWQGDDLVVLTSKGAKQLIEILKEFVDEN